MKKLLMGSFVLMFFAISVSLVQMSCSKEAIAQGNTSTQLNKLLYIKSISNTTHEIWISNYDGTGQTKVNILLPAGIVFSVGLSPKLSPDCKKLFFAAGPSYPSDPGVSANADIYSCNIDGTSLTKVIARTTEKNLTLSGAY
jgi:hypothetical protein